MAALARTVRAATARVTPTAIAAGRKCFTDLSSLDRRNRHRGACPRRAAVRHLPRSRTVPVGEDRGYWRAVGERDCARDGAAGRVLMAKVLGFGSLVGLFGWAWVR